RVFAEVKHGAELATRQFVLLAIRADQGAAVDIEFPTVELVAFNATTFFADSTQIHGTRQQVASTDSQFAWVKRFGDVIVCTDFEAENFIDFVIAASQEHQSNVSLLTQLTC